MRIAIGAWVLMVTSVASAHWGGFDVYRTAEQNLIRLMSQPHIQLSIPECGDAYYRDGVESEVQVRTASDSTKFLSGTMDLFGAELDFVAAFRNDTFLWLEAYAQSFADFEAMYNGISGGTILRQCSTSKFLDVSIFAIDCILDTDGSFWLTAFIHFDVGAPLKYGLMGLHIGLY